MENPIIAIRKEKGFTLADMAVLSNISVVTLSRMENGAASYVSPKVLKLLTEWGYDKNEIEEDYQKWKVYKIEQLKAKALA